MFLVLDKGGEWCASHDWFDSALRYAKQYVGPGSTIARAEDGVLLAKVVKPHGSVKPFLRSPTDPAFGGGVLPEFG